MMFHGRSELLKAAPPWGGKAAGLGQSVRFRYLLMKIIARSCKKVNKDMPRLRLELRLGT